MKLALAALALALASGCSDSDEPSFEPWTVVATQQNQSSDSVSLAIDYLAPNGAVVTWQRLLTDDALVLEAVNTEEIVTGPIVRWIECWYEAVVGETLPECARSEQTLTSTPPN